ncbi:GMP synthase (glutamine-hydrolyzing), partial [Candidatus Nomurabacteria bacterium]|nr:GMP synthase (glutamine-hydrolyzing) [Candidatus Nomurabacteria bacterium]
MEHEKVLVLDFGGQYNQLIARRVRDINVYCEVWSYKTPLEKIRAGGFKGIIFTGGPNSVYLKGSPVCDPEILELGIPVLGICYGGQLIAFLKAGVIAKADRREYGKTLTR